MRSVAGVRGLFWFCLTLPLGAQACMKEGELPVFFCEAMQGKKYIELCSKDLDQQAGYLVYRFGALNEHQAEGTVELEYPRQTANSLKRFFGAAYQDKHTIRFVSGGHDYIVFSRHRSAAELASKENIPVDDERYVDDTYEYGVEVQDRKTRNVSTILCSEVPAFYAHSLKDFIACDPETPVGKACID